MDPVRYPSLAAYASRLPDGLASYPECSAKGSMIRSALEGHDLDVELDRLPDAISDLVRAPPPPTQWVPLVLAEAVFHLVCDRFYPTEEEAIAWSYQRTVQMATNPLYRKLAAVAGPKIFLKMASRVHKLFERGTNLDVQLRPSSAHLELTHPPHVHSPLNQVTNVGMVRAVIDITGGKNGVCKMTRSTPRGAIFECSWE